MRRGVIDIGTNSVKLLVADVDGRVVKPIWEGSEQTRLGQGLYEGHRLQPGAMSRTMEAVAKFAFKAGQWNVTSVRAIATSAVRDAVNQGEFLRNVRAVSGIEVEVISGEQEADWAYAGVRSDPALVQGPLLILDVGGGSTQFILGEALHPQFRQSFPIGTVRLWEQLRPGDPPSEGDWNRCRSWLEDFLNRKVAAPLHQAMQTLGSDTVQLVGTGGTAAILAAIDLALTAFNREKIEQACLLQERVRHHQEFLWGLPLTKRRKINGLPANKADVILFGVAVFRVVMEAFGFAKVRVSTRGLRFGALAAP
jgi:exopolyphosphatase/guanosine-5'-triphosphate,3'-diphosphate pyrophosphatase